MDTKFNIAFAVDQGYLQHLAVAMTSLVENNKELPLNIFVFKADINFDAFEKFKSLLVKKKIPVNWIRVPNDLFDEFVTPHHFTKTMYYRLLIPELITEDKVLYLDTDVVINGSLKKIFELDISNSYLAAVLDPWFDRHKDLNIKERPEYFNSGVIMLNCQRWRDDDISNKVKKFILTNSAVLEYPDQCGINSVVNGKFKVLPPKYNQQSVIFEEVFSERNYSYSAGELHDAKNDPVVIHFTGTLKPWHFVSKHPYKYLYWRYLRKTPYWNYIPPDFTLLNVVKHCIPPSIKEKLKSLYG